MKGRHPKITASMITEERKLTEALNALLARSAMSVAIENQRLSYHLSLITDLTLWDKTYEAMTVWSLVHCLINENERKNILENTDPSSNLFQNPRAIDSLLKCLEDWSKNELISNETPLEMVFFVLASRFDENKLLLAIEK